MIHMGRVDSHAYLSARWYMQRDGVLGSCDSVAAFSVRGQVVTIFYRIHEADVESADSQEISTRHWLESKGVVVHFRREVVRGGTRPAW